MSDQDPASTDTLDDAASQWLSRRDRGLTAAEQDNYLEWLYRDPAHGRAILRLERGWSALNKLELWRPAHSPVPNPDLLAPRSRVRRYWPAMAMLAGVAAVAVMLFHGRASERVPGKSPRAAIIYPAAERQVLEDGSVVELNTGARVDVKFTADARHVRLLEGEAHFTVAKNPHRPFIVMADKVSVRAVGTAFSMNLGTKEVSVLVTEGQVEVRKEKPGATSGDVSAPPVISLGIRQSATVLLESTLTPEVRDVTPAEMERALGWQNMRLKFIAMPLRDVLVEFNRYNHTQLFVDDEATAALLIEGSFRADNVDAFVRLLESSFGVRAGRAGNRITLRQAL